MRFIVAIGGNSFLDEIFDTFDEAATAAQNALNYPGDYYDIYMIESPIMSGTLCTVMAWEGEYYPE